MTIQKCLADTNNKIIKTKHELSEEMNALPAVNAYKNGGTQALKAQRLKEFSSLDEVKDNRTNISYKDYDEEIYNFFFHGGTHIMNLLKEELNRDLKYGELSDAFWTSDPVKYLGIDPNSKSAKLINEYSKRMDDIAPHYFEGKFNILVNVNEFKAVVLPSSTELTIKNKLKLMGMPIYEYSNNEERLDKTIEASKLEGVRFSKTNTSRSIGKGDITDKEVKNVILVDTEKKKLPTTREEVLAILSTMSQPFRNEDMGYDIYVSNSDAKHTMSFRNKDQIKVIGGIGEVIRESVRIGELPVDESEKKTTKAVHIFYCPVNIDKKQYSARLVVKEYFRGNYILDQMNLYNMQLRKEKVDETPIQRNAYPTVLSSTNSVYKVKDLIHNTQENDKKNFLE